MDTPTPNAPSFSDIKDSDDENQSKMTPSGDVQDKPSIAFFDSEMFEWTQRPCSPELCSSPFKLQVSGTDENDENQGKTLAEDLQGLESNQLSTENTRCVNSKQGSEFVDVMLPGLSSLGIKKSNDQKGGKRF
ncbi:protein BREAST CANCER SUSCEPTIBILITY 1-like [Quillaja saponaria]|uniref:Protein BREAST CANCER SUSCEPTIBILITY 1-like n=1 Tax=Quillaja saponaria TaxID=32244 RepID=A0AAD7PVQ3_QUISA|nr:protein BREAST CANCER SUSCEPTIBILITY 1-like [Quillaja saponaria]